MCASSTYIASQFGYPLIFMMLAMLLAGSINDTSLKRPRPLDPHHAINSYAGEGHFLVWELIEVVRMLMGGHTCARGEVNAI